MYDPAPGTMLGVVRRHMTLVPTLQGLWGLHVSCLHAALRGTRFVLEPAGLCLSPPPPQNPSCQGPKALGSSWATHRQGESSGKCRMHPMTPPPPCTHFIPCTVVLWILGLASAVWEDLQSFLPELQEAKNRSCPRPFLSLGLLSKDLWIDEGTAACGQSGESAF